MWHALLAADRASGAHVSALLASSPVAPLFIWLSVIGARAGLWLLLGAVAWVAFPARRMAVWRLLLALGLTGLLVDGLLKPLVDRARPFEDRPEVVLIGDRPTTPSFPSGHAATAGAAALALGRVWPAASLPIWLLALSVALSRVVLGVHFPLDITAGLFVGYLVSRFVFARPPYPNAPVGGTPLV